MAEDRRLEDEYDEDDQRRGAKRESMRRNTPPKSSRTSNAKRGAPVKFNGIHRRRSKRTSW